MTENEDQIEVLEQGSDSAVVIGTVMLILGLAAAVGAAAFAFGADAGLAVLAAGLLAGGAWILRVAAVNG